MTTEPRYFPRSHRQERDEQDRSNSIIWQVFGLGLIVIVLLMFLMMVTAPSDDQNPNNDLVTEWESLTAEDQTAACISVNTFGRDYYINGSVANGRDPDEAARRWDFLKQVCP